MLKNIPALILAGALALSAAPALAEYQSLCLSQLGGYTAGIRIDIVKKGLSPGTSTRAISSKSFYTGVGSNGIEHGEWVCFSPRWAGIRPGDSFRFMVNPLGDIGGRGNKFCGPNRDRKRGYENLFLMPDGRPEGKLYFKSWGGLYHVSCEVEHSDAERMHSGCGATPDGMRNAGCNRFELDQEWNLGTRSNTQIPDAVAMNASIGQFNDLLVRARYNPDQTRNDGYTGLHVAAEHGRNEHLGLLVQRGANLDPRADDGSTPLMVALAAGRFGAALKLLESGAHPSLPREDGEFPLRYAAEQGSAKVVQALLDHGARINALHPKTGQSALDAAKTRQDRDRNKVLDLLRRAGAEERVHTEVIPNLVAIDAGLDKLEDALRGGSDVNESTGGRRTALHIAAELEHHSHYISELLAAGADPNLQDDQGRTPLMAAIEANHDHSLGVIALLEGGANPNLPRADGNFPLYLATELVRDDIVSAVLLFSGDKVDVNQRHPGADKTAMGLAEELFKRDNKAEHEFIWTDLLNAGGGR